MEVEGAVVAWLPRACWASRGQLLALVHLRPHRDHRMAGSRRAPFHTETEAPRGTGGGVRVHPGLDSFYLSSNPAAPPVAVGPDTLLCFSEQQFPPLWWGYSRTWLRGLQ